ncbi:type II secretion system protein GspC [Thermodesulfobacteriota bacterium]
MNRLLFFLNILLLTAACYFSVNSFYQILAARVEPDRVNVIGPKVAPSSEKLDLHPLSYYQIIINRNLFNTKTDVAKKSKTIDIETLKQTKLELRLWGTVTGESGQTYAVIEDKKEKSQNLYRAGDAIQSAILKMILREKIILTVNGKDEVLPMEEMLSSKTGRRRRAPSAPLRTAISNTSDSLTLERSVVEDAVKNINTLMKQVRIRPHFRDGKPDGLSVTGMKHGSLFRKMGLKNGDIITGVDGKQISSVDDALSFYKGLKSASEMQLQIKRRGIPRTMNYNFE